MSESRIRRIIRFRGFFPSEGYEADVITCITLSSHGLVQLPSNKYGALMAGLQTRGSGYRWFADNNFKEKRSSRIETGLIKMMK